MDIYENITIVAELQCEPCSDCYQQIDPFFNSSGSSTYKALTCQQSSAQVLAYRTDMCLYQVSYGDGSYTIRDFVTETVSFGSSGSVPNVAVSYGHDNEWLFVGATCLLGLGHFVFAFSNQSHFYFLLLSGSGRKFSFDSGV
ncbi:Protein ASPARTIC PROTEASE IN GUARD CELL 1 [Forsythia ovata]|uniref:Protein ASPARTIC PROTEASE IN GUARD CELL 1 n=1 Tax=Forsythia ovata TaxID=205694 RepID=A0ABD1S6P6_9LAMI